MPVFNYGQPSEIVPGFLWLSGVRGAAEHIKKLNIDHVLNMAAVPDANAGSVVRDPYQGQLDKSVNYKGVECYDHVSHPIDQHFEETYMFISQAKARNGRCYVHCVAGVSRSASIVIAYLMRANRWTLATALEHTRKLRPCINPNDAFMRQLANYEHQLLSDGIITKPTVRRRRDNDAYDMRACFD